MLVTGVCRIAAFCVKSSISFNFRSGLDFLCKVQCFGVLYCLVLGIGPENQQQVVHTCTLSGAGCTQLCQSELAPVFSAL